MFNPGTYIPILKEEEVKSALNQPVDEATMLPQVNVKELADLYKIEVAVPVVKRQDFDEIIKLHEFNYDVFDRHIVLPNNTYPEFTSAEYIAGMLRLYIPKTKYPVSNLQINIVVY